MSTSIIRYPTPIADFTSAMSTTHTKLGTFKGIRVGRICNITFAITLTSNVNATATLCTIPDGYRPYVQQRFISEGLDVTASGNIRSTISRSSGATIEFSFCYISQV